MKGQVCCMCECENGKTNPIVCLSGNLSCLPLCLCQSSWEFHGWHQEQGCGCALGNGPPWVGARALCVQLHIWASSQLNSCIKQMPALHSAAPLCQVQLHRDPAPCQAAESCSHSLGTREVPWHSSAPPCPGWAALTRCQQWSLHLKWKSSPFQRVIFLPV